MDPIISIHDLGKRFVLGAGAEHDTLRDHLASTFSRLFRREGANRKPTEHWALRDVSFDVAEGEVLAIIGHNGAGKSTLLKILSQISEPTEGEIRVRGRIASLLEVGTGFHPELSGRENIYLNGAILGMSRTEIRDKFDAIVAFAEVGKFLDTPVKRYSSGMYVRLAFAVAAHLEPEILVIDEVLAVGDAAFQAKCLAKMGEISRQRGRTILFVSHNMQAVQNLCGRAVLLQEGRVKQVGDTREVVKTYLASATAAAAEKTWAPEVAPGNAEARLHAIRLFDAGGNRSGVFSSRKPLFVEIEFHCPEPVSSFCAGFDIATPEGETVFRCYQNDQEESLWPTLHRGRNVWRCEIPAGLFNAGVYLLSPKITRHTIHWILNGGPQLQFEIILDHGVSPYWSGLRTRVNRPGVIAPILPWTDVTP